MNKIDQVKNVFKVAIIGATLTVGYTVPVSAHSVMACYTDVLSFCGSDINCRERGKRGCFDHIHQFQLDPPPPPPGPSSSTVRGGNGKFGNTVKSNKYWSIKNLKYNRRLR